MLPVLMSNANFAPPCCADCRDQPARAVQAVGSDWERPALHQAEHPPGLLCQPARPEARGGSSLQEGEDLPLLEGETATCVEIRRFTFAASRYHKHLSCRASLSHSLDIPEPVPRPSADPSLPRKRVLCYGNL